MTAIDSPLTDALRDRYALERELGRGGMATVYLARDLRHDRPVALKVLHPELAATLGPERFLREIRTTARLQHPHILPVLDSGEAAGLLWYTMPYVEGESLRDRLRREPQLPLEEAVRIAREVADALDYAHEQASCTATSSRRTSSSRDGHALVADFGVAKALGRTAMVASSPGPARGGHAGVHEPGAGRRPGRSTRRSDIYAWAACSTRCWRASRPITGPTPQAIIAKRHLEPVPRAARPAGERARATGAGAHPGARAKTPADRFATAAEFARALGGRG